MIKEFIRRMKGFYPFLYKLYKENGSRVLDQADMFVNKVSIDEVGENDVKGFLGFIDSHIKENGDEDLKYKILAEVLQRVIPVNENINNRWEPLYKTLKEYHSRDFREHVPEKLRGKAFGGNKIIPIEKWKLKEDANLDEIKSFIRKMNPSVQKETERERTVEKIKEEVPDILENYIEHYDDETKRIKYSKEFLNIVCIFARNEEAKRAMIWDMQEITYRNICLLEEQLYSWATVFTIPMNMAVKRMQERYEDGVYNDLPNLKSFFASWPEGDFQDGLYKERLKERIYKDLSVMIKNAKEQFISEESQESVILEFRAVKGIPHSIWGHLADVCNKKYPALWETDSFFLVEMFDRVSETVIGYATCLDEVEDDRKVLIVTGIQPTTYFLSKMSTEDFLKIFEEGILEIKKEGEYQNIYLRENISNRMRLVSAAGKRYKELIRLKKKIEWPVPHADKSFDTVREIISTKSTSASKNLDNTNIQIPLTDKLLSKIQHYRFKWFFIWHLNRYFKLIDSPVLFRKLLKKKEKRMLEKAKSIDHELYNVLDEIINISEKYKKQKFTEKEKRKELNEKTYKTIAGLNTYFVSKGIMFFIECRVSYFPLLVSKEIIDKKIISIKDGRTFLFSIKTLLNAHPLATGWYGLLDDFTGYVYLNYSDFAVDAKAIKDILKNRKEFFRPKTRDIVIGTISEYLLRILGLDRKRREGRKTYINYLVEILERGKQRRYNYKWHKDRAIEFKDIDIRFIRKAFYNNNVKEIFKKRKDSVRVHELSHYNDFINNNFPDIENRDQRSKSEALAILASIALGPIPFYEVLRLSDRINATGSYQARLVLNAFSEFFDFDVKIDRNDHLKKSCSVSGEHEEYTKEALKRTRKIFEKLYDKSEEEIREAAKWAYKEIGKEDNIGELDEDIFSEKKREEKKGSKDDENQKRDTVSNIKTTTSKKLLSDKKDKERKEWKKIYIAPYGDKKYSLRWVQGYLKHMIDTVKQHRLGKIPGFSVSRSIPTYDSMIKNDYLKVSFLEKGLTGLLKYYIKKNQVVGRSTNYLDAAGGIGCAATEATVKYGIEGVKTFVADLKEWLPDDLVPEEAKRARESGKSRGVEDILSRQFTFFKGNIENIKLPEKMDIITNIAALQYTDNPLQVIVNLYNHLKENGILLTGYYVSGKNKKALDAFYDLLETLSILGATVTAKTTFIKNENMYLLKIAIVKNNTNNIKLNWLPEKSTISKVYDKRTRLSEKAIYYDNPENKPVVEFISLSVGKTPLEEFIQSNTYIIKTLLKDSNKNIMLRVPVEVIEMMDENNIKDFLESFQAEGSNGYIRLFYMSGDGKVSDDVYKKYELEKKPLPEDLKKSTKENTITLFSVLKGEIDSDEIGSKRDIDRLLKERLGPVSHKNTQVIPIGLQNDPTGLIRGSILGLRMIYIARQQKELDKIDKVFAQETLDQYRELCEVQGIEGFNLTHQDIIDLAIGGINELIRALKKVINLLPIVPIDSEVLREEYKHVREVILSA